MVVTCLLDVAVLLDAVCAGKADGGRHQREEVQRPEDEGADVRSIRLVADGPRGFVSLAFRAISRTMWQCRRVCSCHRLS